jgi:hypothetical protein
LYGELAATLLEKDAQYLNDKKLARNCTAVRLARAGCFPRRLMGDKDPVVPADLLGKPNPLVTLDLRVDGNLHWVPTIHPFSGGQVSHFDALIPYRIRETARCGSPDVLVKIPGLRDDLCRKGQSRRGYPLGKNQRSRAEPRLQPRLQPICKCARAGSSAQRRPSRSLAVAAFPARLDGSFTRQ